MLKFLIIVTFAATPLMECALTRWFSNKKEIPVSQPPEHVMFTPKNMPLSTGEAKSVDNFLLHQVLGQGNRAMVYLAEKNDGTLYAMKMVNITYATWVEDEKKSGLNAITSIITERNALIELDDCPWVVTLYYTFWQSDTAFFVLELGSEMSFANSVDNLTINKLALAEVIVAVEEMHKKGIEHGDLTPNNILIGADGHIKLTDFGTAQQLGETNDDWQLLHDTLKPILENKRKSFFKRKICRQKDHVRKFLKTLGKMRDDTLLPALKNLAFFDGIRWDDVVNRVKAPFNSAPVKKSGVPMYYKHSTEKISTKQQDELKDFPYARPSTI